MGQIKISEETRNIEEIGLNHPERGTEQATKMFLLSPMFLLELEVTS